MVAMSSGVLCVDLCGTAERDELKCEKLTKNSLRIRLYLAVGKITKVFRQDCLLAGCGMIATCEYTTIITGY